MQSPQIDSVKVLQNSTNLLQIAPGSILMCEAPVFPGVIAACPTEDPEIHPAQGP